MGTGRLRYGCVCFALPNRLLHHVANTVGGAHAERLRDHAHASTALRGARMAKGAPPPSAVGRESLDGKGMAVDAVVHYGQAFANAMWTGQQMHFGAGDGEHILGFAQSLDIVARQRTPPTGYWVRAFWGPTWGARYGRSKTRATPP